jgi:YggT family protein
LIIFLVTLINIIVQGITLIVIVDVFLSYFMSPYHPVKMSLDRIVRPLLAPIRNVVPPIGMIDFSPLMLLVSIQIIGRILIGLLASFL